MGSLTEREERAVRAFVERLSGRLGDRLVALVLFGSKARGTARADSDVDLLAIVTDHQAVDVVYDVVTDILLEDDLYLSVKVFEEEEFERLRHPPSVFVQEVQHDGVPLWKAGHR